MESLSWHYGVFEREYSNKIVKSYYDFSNELDQILTSAGNHVHQFNDDFLWNLRNQGTTLDNYPKPDADQIASIDRNKTIDYWWKGSWQFYNYIASVDDFVNKNFTSITNWNLDYLFFGGADFQGKRTAEYIYDEWHPGVFATNYENNQSQIYLEDENGNYPSWINGAVYSCWKEKNQYTGFYLSESLVSFGQKSWHGQNNLISYKSFNNTSHHLGLDLI
jgi:hypothetical protein